MKDNMKEPTLEREYTQLWSESHYGSVAIARQYREPDYIGDSKNPENRPIYVALEGHQPRPLDEVLLENQQLNQDIIKKERESTKRIDDNVELLRRRIEDLEDKVLILEYKKWYQFWK